MRRKHAVFLFHSVTSLKLEVHMMQIIIHMTQFSKLSRYNQNGTQSGTHSPKNALILYFSQESLVEDRCYNS